MVELRSGAPRAVGDHAIASDNTLKHGVSEEIDGAPPDAADPTATRSFGGTVGRKSGRAIGNKGRTRGITTGHTRCQTEPEKANALHVSDDNAFLSPSGR